MHVASRWCNETGRRTGNYARAEQMAKSDQITGSLLTSRFFPDGRQNRSAWPKDGVPAIVVSGVLTKSCVIPAKSQVVPAKFCTPATESRAAVCEIFMFYNLFSATDFRLASPFSNWQPHILSKSTNRPKIFPMTLFFPAMLHVTTV